jgi:hypothetical protein
MVCKGHGLKQAKVEFEVKALGVTASTRQQKHADTGVWASEHPKAATLALLSAH